MKLHKLFLSALLAAVITFVMAGCGDNSSSSSKGSANAAAGNDEIKTAADSAAASMDGVSQLNFVKVEKVNDNYAVVCYKANLEGKGESNFAVHMKKQDGKWTCVEAEDNWEPKDRLK